ncbi:hypothetical protein NE237_028316 [Protea cynaroides]|uniref:Uncharacterized protein n=1 Tax=Protea cynaroides TaxID=273540 RepID=A0A9Q0JSR4_9MAGN|nr:hypothetical protein NE237_028316 [Protea cynaroides]
MTCMMIIAVIMTHKHVYKYEALRHPKNSYSALAYTFVDYYLAWMRSISLTLILSAVLGSEREQRETKSLNQSNREEWYWGVLLEGKEGKKKCRPNGVDLIASIRLIRNSSLCHG